MTENVRSNQRSLNSAVCQARASDIVNNVQHWKAKLNNNKQQISNINAADKISGILSEYIQVKSRSYRNLRCHSKVSRMIKWIGDKVPVSENVFIIFNITKSIFGYLSAANCSHQVSPGWDAPECQSCWSDGEKSPPLGPRSPPWWRWSQTAVGLMEDSRQTSIQHTNTTLHLLLINYQRVNF